MRIRPWMIWTVVVICLLCTFVGLILMLFAVFHHSGTDRLMTTGVLLAALPVLFLLALVHGGIGGREDVKLASRKGRLLIWGTVVLLAFGTGLAVVWALGLERQ